MKITKQGIVWNVESEKAMYTASLDMMTVRHEVMTLKPSVARDSGKSASRRTPQRQSKRKKEEQHTPCTIQDARVDLEAELTRLLEQDDDALVDDLLDEAARAARLLISMSAEDPECDPEAIEVISAGISQEEKHLESIHLSPNSKLLEEADALATSPSCCGLTNEECLAEAALNVAIGNPDVDDEDVIGDEDAYQGNNDNADDVVTAEQQELLIAEGRVRGVLKRRLVQGSDALLAEWHKEAQSGYNALVYRNDMAQRLHVGTEIALVAKLDEHMGHRVDFVYWKHHPDGWPIKLDNHNRAKMIIFGERMLNYTPIANYDGAEVILQGFGAWLKRAKDDGRPVMPDETIRLRDMWQAALCEGANTLAEDACFACGQADANLPTWICSLCCRIFHDCCNAALQDHFSDSIPDFSPTCDLPLTLRERRQLKVSLTIIYVMCRANMIHTLLLAELYFGRCGLCAAWWADADEQ